MKTLSLLAAAAVVAFAAPSFANDKTVIKSETKVEADAKGNLNKTVSDVKKDATGKISSETTTKVDVDSDGDSEKTVKTEEVNDPKGLFNKTKTVTETNTKTEGGVVTTEQKKKVDGKTVVDTKVSH